MIELIALIFAVGVVTSRAQQRRQPAGLGVVALLGGWITFFLLSGALGPVSMILRWLWILLVLFYFEHSSAGEGEAEESWQCPDCRIYNDPGTFVCLCGYDREPEEEIASDEA